MDKVFHEPPSGGLMPIRHKEFNEFIKRRNNYKLRDLKAMFGFKPMITGSPVTISSNGNLSLVKMPHSNFKERSHQFNSGIGKCPCGQTFEYILERDMAMKLRTHSKFFPSLQKVSI